jgi:hypothetical protein
MPCDLRDPTGEGAFPFYYDQRYDEAPNQFEPGSFDMDNYLQSIIFDVMGKNVSQEKLNLLKKEIEGAGFFHRNVGDETFRTEVIKLLKQKLMTMARKVAANAARSK